MMSVSCVLYLCLSVMVTYQVFCSCEHGRRECVLYSVPMSVCNTLLHHVLSLCASAVMS